MLGEPWWYWLAWLLAAVLFAAPAARMWWEDRQALKRAERERLMSERRYIL